MKSKSCYQSGDKIGGPYQVQQALTLAANVNGSVASEKHPFTPMRENVIEIEADSLEEARGLMDFQMLKGFHLISEQVISDGRPKTVKGVADTAETAFVKAQGEIPSNANILEKKELIAPERKVITVEAIDEQSARSKASFQARSQLGDTAIVKHIKLAVVGSQGFLGIGRSPNHYEVEICRQAVVEITYKPKVRISLRIGREHSPKEHQ